MNNGEHIFSPNGDLRAACKRLCRAAVAGKGGGAFGKDRLHCIGAQRIGRVVFHPGNDRSLRYFRDEGYIIDGYGFIGAFQYDFEVQIYGFQPDECVGAAHCVVEVDVNIPFSVAEYAVHRRTVDEYGRPAFDRPVGDADIET